MIKTNNSRMEKYSRRIVLAGALCMLALLFASSIVYSAPSAPTITYSLNSTYVSSVTNRSQDAKGTITTVNLSSIQQDYKWKAYVGLVTGSIALADANGVKIYDWSVGSANGEVYISKHAGISFSNIVCASSPSILNEQTNLSISNGAADSISATFNYTSHSTFFTGTTQLTGCNSTATYVNGSRQAMNGGAYFQEILLMDNITKDMVYAGIVNASAGSYNGTNNRYDFQMIVAENESSTTPTTYFFWVELG